MRPVAVANALWDLAVEKIEAPQLAIVIVSDAKTCAFRHNCVAGMPALVGALRQLADQLERGEVSGVLTDVSREKDS